MAGLFGVTAVGAGDSLIFQFGMGLKIVSGKRSKKKNHELCPASHRTLPDELRRQCMVRNYQKQIEDVRRAPRALFATSRNVSQMTY